MLRVLSLVVANGGFSLVMGDELLPVLDSLVAEHGPRRSASGGRGRPSRSASSGCGLPALQHRPGSGGTWALLLPSMRDRPRPRIRTMSPATAGRFFTTESPGKPYIVGFNMLCFQACKSLNCYCRLVTKLGSTLCNPVGCSTPGPTPQCLLKFMSIESVMLSNHLILCWPLLLLPSVFLSIFSNESALHIRWPKYWSLSFSISPSNTIQG